jgi:glutamine---fructose-6-phosphate transaminase (isomerizing)
MCGIFGIVTKPNARFDASQLHQLVDQLFLLSESRGKDSAGLVLADHEQITVYKRPERARRMIGSAQYKHLLQNYEATHNGVIALGHARMVTNGKKVYHNNNQPVIKDGLVCIHNGIIVNDAELWEQHPQLERHYQVDTEVMLSLIRHNLTNNQPLETAVINALQQTRGANSIALLTQEHNGIVLATTNGSLYYALSDNGMELVFASEKYILQQTISQPTLQGQFQHTEIHQIRPCNGIVFTFETLQAHAFSMNAGPTGDPAVVPTGEPREIRDITDEQTEFIADHTPDPDPLMLSTYHANDAFIQGVNRQVGELRRCTRCILPETFPFIEFDADGVCNYCLNYQSIDFKGEEAIERLVAPYRRDDDKPDVLVPLSGGRDSSYGIHYIKRVLGMNPVAYTYDWGLVTDLARRNISRMCSQLEIEHILISADIKTKRENVRKNVLAWLKKPALGTVPLFMAGDKQFFYYSNMLQKQMEIDLTLYSMNPLERTDFKVGFCGINEVSRKQEKHYALALKDRLHMLGYYGWHFLSNPAYLNTSLFDSFHAFVSYYMIPKDYHILYDYLRWDEQTIEDTLLNEYDWETAPDTVSTWRIGDGTAAFYNYIYYTAAGFSENDTFRSNQIREGMIDRDTALTLAERDNQPRYASMRWYAETIGFDFETAVQKINAMPKRYQR